MLATLLFALTLQSSVKERVSGYFIIERACKQVLNAKGCGCELRVTPKYILDDLVGHRREVLLDPVRMNSYGGPQKMVGQWVTVNGQDEQGQKYFRMKDFSVVTPQALRAAMDHNDPGVYADMPPKVQSILLNSLTKQVHMLKPGPIVKPYLNICCRTADTTNITPEPASDFQVMMKSTFPGFDHYVQDMSYGKWTVAGSSVVGWINLPKNTSDYQTFYANIFTGLTLWDHTKLLPDIIAMLDPTVDFSQYSGLNIFMNTSDGGGGTKYASYYFMTVDGLNQWMPITEDNVGHDTSALTHEDGHNFGFDHSSGPYNTPYDSIWDTMSGGYHQVTDSVLGQITIGNGYNAFHRYKAGWLTKDRIVFALPGETHTFHLEQLTDPTNTTDPLMAKIYIGGSARHYYTVEARKPVGYDIALPSCVVLHDVLENRYVTDSSSSAPRYDRAAEVVDIDNNGDPNDAAAQWTPGETYTDSTNGITVSVLSEDATGFNVQVTVNANQPKPGIITNGNDDGPGSFRDWFYYLEDFPAAPPIFKIPKTDPSYNSSKGFFRIKLLSTFPDIVIPGVVIDGSSQVAYTGNTNPNGPVIMLDGTSAGASVCGLTLKGSNQVVKNISVGNFLATGILAYGATNPQIQSCYLGIEPDGVTPAPCKYEGVAAILGTTNLIVGGNGTGNLVSGNTGYGIDTWDPNTTGTTVYGNYVGTDRTGTIAVPNGGVGVGVFRSNSHVTIGGTGTGLGNVISGNNSGIFVQGPTTNTVTIQGNIVGLDATGKIGVGNSSSGIYVTDAATNVTIQNNTVSGNLGNEGITILNAGTTGVLVSNNFIGTDITGKVAVKNEYSGIWVGDSATATIQNNVISGNGSAGVTLMGSIGTTISANRMGTDSTGEKALPNAYQGVYIGGGSTGCTIGGVAGSENYLSGNTYDGIALSDATTTGNHLSGNMIGITPSGAALGNLGNGIWVGNGANGNFIGESGLPNTIVSSKYSGIAISGAGTSNNVVKNNFIGALKDGTARPNLSEGVTFYSGATSNVIGGVNANEGNVIANGQNGIGVYDAATVGNSFRGNQIFGSTYLGIQLSGNDGNYGVTPNDYLDADSGPNDLQNYPVLTQVVRGGGALNVTGTFNGAATTTVTLDFYSVDTPTASGFGEGKTYLGSQTVKTDSNGSASFSLALPNSTSAYVSSTATGPDGSTSEFSAVSPVLNGLDTLVLSPTTVVGGLPSTGTLTLTGLVQSGTATITLSSSNTNLATVPASISIGTGSSQTTFSVSTSVVTSPQSVIITATYLGVSRTATLNLVPAGLISLTFAPASAVGGSNFTGTVTTGAPAPSSGTTVQLSVDQPGVATIPATVVVTSGNTTATFTVASVPVPIDTLVTGTATLGSQSVTGTLTVGSPKMSSLAISPTSVAGGASATGTITLTGRAPKQGVLVSIASNQSAATSPTTVTVPAGSSTVTFTISTVAVTGDVTATFTASTSGSTAQATLGIKSPKLAALSINPSSMTGGTSSSGTVQITSAAGSNGVTITLSSDNAAASVPATVTIPNGQLSASFTLTTVPVTADRQVNVKATLSGASLSTPIAVKAPIVSSVVLNPSNVMGGQKSIATVTLSAPAASGTTLTLSSDDPSATVPASVSITANATTTTFTVTTIGVSSNKTVHIKATLNASSGTGSLTITPPSVTSFTVSPTSVAGGISSTGTVTLSGAAPASGLQIGLASDNAAATMPTAVTIPSGQKTVSFTVSTIPVKADTPANLTATFGTSKAKAVLTVLAPKVVSVSISPYSVLGGTSTTGTVTISGASPTGGITVSLSSNQSSASLPASINVLAGATTATFTISTKPVPSDLTVTITATLGASSAKGAFVIAAPKINSLVLSPTAVIGGQSSTATLTLSGPAPVGGLVVATSCDLASVPGTVTVPANATSVTFTVTTAGASTDKTATLKATLNGAIFTATLTIKAIKVASVSVNPSTVVGGSSTVATVTLSAASPAGGTVVSLSLSNSVATSPHH